MRGFVLLVVYAVAIVGSAAHAGEGSSVELAYETSSRFAERSAYRRESPDVRAYINTPTDRGEATKTRLIVYALPNGNTIEQTLGCKRSDKLNWRYDIQHVAAQVRLLRSLAPKEKIILLCAEAKGLSWPAWRRSHKGANRLIVGMLDQWRRRFAGDASLVTLTGHSGGGSFMHGVIEGGEAVPAWIDRIAMLDANYAFEAKQHAEKLRKWLTSNDRNHTIVIAYDDRRIELNGKRVVSPTGGTYRATGRMVQAFRSDFDLQESISPPFVEQTGLNGRFRSIVHQNPQNKILHTALVGEMNGLVHAQTIGTVHEGKWGHFGGPRAYGRWIEDARAMHSDATGKN